MNNYADIFEASSIIWPLCFLLIILFVLRQVRDDVKPIFQGMIGTLATQSQSNAVGWALGILIATLGSLQALGEVAHAMNWKYIEAAAKVLQPGLAALLGYIMASPAQKAKIGQTNPPIPTP
jgi:signal transduction histidine kinase